VNIVRLAHGVSAPRMRGAQTAKLSRIKRIINMPARVFRRRARGINSASTQRRAGAQNNSASLAPRIA